MRFPALLFLLIPAAAGLSASPPGGEERLFTREAGGLPDLSRIEVRDVVLSGGKDCLRLETAAGAIWPGITLRASEGSWDLSLREQIIVPLRNTGSNAVTVVCRAENPGQEGQMQSVSGSLALPPGASGDLVVKLNRAGDTLGGKLFGMKGYPGGPAGGRAVIDPVNIRDLLLFLDHPQGGSTLEMGVIRSSGDYRSAAEKDAGNNPFFPFVDAYGQYRHREWPGKIHSDEELSAARKAEEKDLAAHPGLPGLDQYGGWGDGPRLRVTGFFRTEKVDGKWWLVDPEGSLFFSQGIDCVMEDQKTPVEERSTWFAEFPGKDPAFVKFTSRVRSIMGHYGGRIPECFSFMKANLLRKYGPDWRKESGEIAQRRMRSWGINTIGNWSEESCRAMHRTPYVDQFTCGGVRMIEGSGGYWGKFPDVFDSGFAEAMRCGMEAKQGNSAGDPWCIGFFSDNELSWGEETSLSLAVLKSPAGQPAKMTFVDELRAKYGEIGILNAAWGTSHASWEELLASREAPERKRAGEDLRNFTGRIAETYFRAARDAVKAVAPQQLYLGCRFAGVNGTVAAASSKYCDVVTYNIYRRSVADFDFPGGDKPLLVGEFHFGALDRGLFHPGLVPTADQNERAKAYGDFVLGAARHPLFVGVHWFQWMDQPLTGRALDGENYQIGFVDVADTPYSEMIETSRRVAGEIYKVRSGHEAAWSVSREASKAAVLEMNAAR